MFNTTLGALGSNLVFGMFIVFVSILFSTYGNDVSSFKNDSAVEPRGAPQGFLCVHRLMQDHSACLSPSMNGPMSTITRTASDWKS